MTSRSYTGAERPQHESRISPSTTQIQESIQTPRVSDPYSESARQKEDKVAISGPGGQPQHVHTSSRSGTHQDKSEEVVITGIRVADVARGLRRLPAGFYTVVHHSGVKWRTENKRSSVNNDVVEWSGPIPIPSDLSNTVCIKVYASFEFQPMLGGEQLRELTTTVKQLLDSSVEQVPFSLFPKAGDIVSPCSSILVTVERRKRDISDPSALSHSSTTESPGELENATNLGHSALSRYRRHGEKRDLEHSIKEFEQALRACPMDHPCRAAAQSNLAMAKFVLYQIDGTDSSLEVPLYLYRNALAARPVGHLDRPSTLIQLAALHFARFEKRRDEGDGAWGVSLLHEAVGLGSTESHENRAATFMLQLHAGRKVGSFHDGQLSVNQDPPSRLTDEDLLILGVRLIHRFERFSALVDLQQAIVLLRILVRSASTSSSRYREGLGNLGMALRYRFNHVGEMTDLEEAISMHRNAIDLTPHGHPDQPIIVGNLGNSLVTRFNSLGELRDLEEAIFRHKDAVGLTPYGHPDKPMYISNLGGSLLTRFERFGELSDFEEAISRFRDAVKLTPHGDPEKPSRLSNLASSLVTRFERLGELSDLEDAISTLRDAVNLTPRGYLHESTFLTSLGNSLKARFEHLGELSDLEEGISIYREAVDMIPHAHPHKINHLRNLGNSFFTRFNYLSDPGDLEEALLRFRDAVDLTPHGHPDKPDHLNNLGNSFKARFRCFGKLSDLEHAVSMLRDALDLTPYGDPRKPTFFNSLGNSLKARFECFGEPSDLQDAILMLRNAVDLSPCGHSKKPHFLNNLGNALITRFQRLGELSDLEDAISRYRDAADLSHYDHLDRPNYLCNLGNSLNARFKHLGEPNDLEEAISLFLLVVSASTCPVSLRFYASQSWISCARRVRHHTLLHSYSVCINLLHQLAWIGLPFAQRCSRLVQVADVVREAAAAALDSGLPETAVELLEQGRSIVWGELFQLRSSYEELSFAHSDHAHRLRELSTALEHASVNHEKAWLSPSEQHQSAAHHTTQSLKQAMADRHRILAIKRDKLLQEIRGFPGFEQFLLRKEFSQLRASAYSGPVVMLNAAESRCDALVVLADLDHVIHVPLPKFPFKRAAGLQKMLEKLLGHARAALCDDRKGDPATRDCISWESLLSNLWNDVVTPVLDALAFSTPEELSRIFWCPTGPFVFLPIHAAGVYGTQHSKPGHKVSDFVISSYVPTLSSQMLSPNSNVAPSGDLRLLAVRQTPSDGLSKLPGVATELKYIKEVINNSPSARATLLESSVGTVEEVLSLMKEADWVHFACHGIQDDVDSGLCLADGRRLKLRDVIALSRPHGGLAFLSACQTATGDGRVSDEAIHIAAGMLFAGYGGVIGTMWSINDKLAPEVARDVYEQLFGSGARPDYREAARALHEAIRRLRDSGSVSFVNWLPFIHVGH